jgi:hypothetical protein
MKNDKKNQNDFFCFASLGVIRAHVTVERVLYIIPIQGIVWRRANSFEWNFSGEANAFVDATHFLFKIN